MQSSIFNWSKQTVKMVLQPIPSPQCTQILSTKSHAKAMPHDAHAMPSKSLMKFNLKNSQNKEKPLIFQIASSPFSISSRCLFPGKASSSII